MPPRHPTGPIRMSASFFRWWTPSPQRYGERRRRQIEPSQGEVTPGHPETWSIGCLMYGTPHGSPPGAWGDRLTAPRAITPSTHQPHARGDVDPPPSTRARPTAQALGGLIGGLEGESHEVWFTLCQSMCSVMLCVFQLNPPPRQGLSPGQANVGRAGPWFLQAPAEALTGAPGGDPIRGI